MTNIIAHNVKLQVQSDLIATLGPHPELIERGIALASSVAKKVINETYQEHPRVALLLLTEHTPTTDSWVVWQRISATYGTSLKKDLGLCSSSVARVQHIVIPALRRTVRIEAERVRQAIMEHSAGSS